MVGTETMPAATENLMEWLALAGFGAYHGLNPGMGWLFALALGLQRKSERAIWTSLIPISIGHALSIAVVALLLIGVGRFVSIDALRMVTAAFMLSFGGYKLFNYYRHPRWVGFQVRNGQLVLWSFLMAFAHGAGLMISPILLGMSHGSGVHSGGHAMDGHAMANGGELEIALGIGVHTLAMLLVMAAVAWIVYRRVGLKVLRTSWINFDLIWAGALIVVGGIALYRALMLAT